MTLRTLRDAESLRDRLAPGIRLAVVGAGLVGTEVTAAATALGCVVTLLDPATRPFERFVGPDIAEMLHGLHRRHGVRVIEDTVSAVENGPGGARLRLSGSAEVVDCDVVVVGVGIEHDDRLAVGAGLARERGVLVDAAQRTSHPYVFAVGDVARTTGPHGPLPPSEHWDAARNEGRSAAAAMLGHTPPEPRSPWFWSDRYGVHLEVVGAFLDGDVTVVRGRFGSDSFTSLAVRAGRCVGAVAINRSAEMIAVRRIVEGGVPVDIDQLSDETVDLRALARAVRGVPG
jgi:3-phenylpropionate/trans-cinnamate dioxygenase ferredoxin reductase component